MKLFRPTWAEINTANFRANLLTLKNLLNPSTKIIAVLKADAYGHGAIPLSIIAREVGVAFIGVSSIEEAVALREAGDKGPILIMGSIFPLENFSAVADYDLTPTIYSREAAFFLKEIAYARKKTLSFHLKIDTGMGRLGLSMEATKSILNWIKAEPLIRLQGIYSHLASSDSDPEFTRQQLNSLLDVKKNAEALGFKNVSYHLANSVATLKEKDTHLDFVRPGFTLYAPSTVGKRMGLVFNPVLSWKSRAIFLKKVPAGTSISYGRTFVTQQESDIITVPVGYADGVPRSVTNKGQVIVKGQKCPIIGRVTMDHIMVDVTGHKVQVGEEVVLIGSQGSAAITAHDWAKWAGTIPYEIFCGISKRVPRVIK